MHEWFNMALFFVYFHIFISPIHQGTLGDAQSSPPPFALTIPL